MPHRPYHRDVHYWTKGFTEPPCGTLEEAFDWSDALEDVTCEECKDALTGERDRPAPDDAGLDQHAP